MPTFGWVTTWKADGPYENHEMSEEEMEEYEKEREMVIENFIELEEICEER